MKHPNPILVADRFPALRGHLLTLLDDLHEDDWVCQTAAPLWSVKDVAAHLLGGDVWILSGKRDGYRPPQNLQSYRELVELINRLNREWVQAARRMSPRLLRAAGVFRA